MLAGRVEGVVGGAEGVRGGGAGGAARVPILNGTVCPGGCGGCGLRTHVYLCLYILAYICVYRYACVRDRRCIKALRALLRACAVTHSPSLTVLPMCLDTWKSAHEHLRYSDTASPRTLRDERFDPLTHCWCRVRVALRC